jgi:hypothetical protein
MLAALYGIENGWPHAHSLGRTAVERLAQK